MPRPQEIFSVDRVYAGGERPLPTLLDHLEVGTADLESGTDRVLEMNQSLIKQRPTCSDRHAFFRNLHMFMVRLAGRAVSDFVDAPVTDVAIGDDAPNPVDACTLAPAP